MRARRPTGLANLLDPNIAQHLLRDEGEVIVDEVRKHWVAYARGTLLVGAALLVAVVTPFLPVPIAWLPMLLTLVLGLWGGYRIVAEYVDRFVITNMRVFRVHGVLNQQMATMPLSRILDITVRKPIQGRLLGYGHFVFESAAQEQGLRDVRYVGDPNGRDLEIQRVVQRSGLRGPKVN